MTGVLLFFVVLAVLAVLAVLLIGVFNMARGSNPQTSQKLMQWRVTLQFVALMIIFFAIWMTH
ncbi:MAG: twin transmembrane helix small protein [Bacteroidota bacterium]